MKKLLFFITLLVCISVAATVSAGGYYGHGYYGGHGGHGYYGGCGWHGGYNGWEVAAAVLGTFIVVDAINRLCYASPAYYVPSGYWTVQKVWVPVTTQSYWVNQYYDQSRNVWVLGHWETRSAGGYWTEQQVWVQQ